MFKNKLKIFQSIFLLICLTSIFHIYSANSISDKRSYFDQKREFPNYFLPEQYRTMALDKIPPEVITQQKELVEKALHSIFKRITLATVAEDGSIKFERYFENLEKLLKKIDPTVRIHSAGGNVRAGMSYLYDNIQTKIVNNPQLSSSDVLKEIASDVNDINGFDVRGVGSDMDVFLSGDQTKLKELSYAAKKYTHALEKTLNLAQLDEKGLKRSLIVRGDFKELGTQTELSSLQGGSSIDLLSLDMTSGALKSPPRYPQVVSDLIKGEFEFLLPIDRVAMKDPTETVIRGTRTMMELPFLSIKNEEDLKRELKLIPLENFSERASGQFDKMVRNARWGGAHNRFHRGAPGSIESITLEISEKVSKDKKNIMIPKFVDHAPIENRPSVLSFPKEYLIDPDTFLKEFTDNGVLYHGTPKVENGLAILHGGMFESSKVQGQAWHGSGAYASPQLKVVNEYTKEVGIVLPVELRKDYPIRIVDLDKLIQNSVLYEKLNNEAKLEKVTLNELLHKKYDIDLIKCLNRENEVYVMIQNTAVFHKGSPKTLIIGIANQIVNDSLPVLQRAALFHSYSNLYISLGVNKSDMPDPVTLKAILEPQIKNAIEEKIRIGTIRISEKATVFDMVEELSAFISPKELSKFMIEKSIEHGNKSRTFYNIVSNCISHLTEDEDIVEIYQLLLERVKKYKDLELLETLLKRYQWNPHLKDIVPLYEPFLEILADREFRVSKLEFHSEYHYTYFMDWVKTKLPSDDMISLFKKLIEKGIEQKKYNMVDEVVRSVNKMSDKNTKMVLYAWLIEKSKEQKNTRLISNLVRYNLRDADVRDMSNLFKTVVELKDPDILESLVESSFIKTPHEDQFAFHILLMEKAEELKDVRVFEKLYPGYNGFPDNYNQETKNKIFPILQYMRDNQKDINWNEKDVDWKVVRQMIDKAKQPPLRIIKFVEELTPSSLKKNESLFGKCLSRMLGR
ncbi:MAG: hypothetical protein A2381_16695 [Bdellovibrionales bacterium RIFOXYB1_FULL_37_110]|nr:MAG: hypothetical protein A2181_07700 [Bdellovibrionales bacterium RIFOXYA1_FULL_38_20]OFZ50037.1 MAG: hypothetical protein A2417_18530 [Bdellovibrionales bacterium RIFOXYC1_FULL_37_79]OFZ59943.1 MAG: hypothetical protein A2381_16695 [Bdellovibrionales bacterium RIFOXYB1_FULL_37_110]OFZ63914.1 MAG: hypothetical protein A2577_05885 [Bdellovibrionales bacterium RIFOXYD1_FULL_36_51]